MRGNIHTTGGPHENQHPAEECPECGYVLRNHDSHDAECPLAGLTAAEVEERLESQAREARFEAHAELQMEQRMERGL